jgi:2-C-methyl-D-erythritol 4-phosphate cytidylyltransferase/2-C-methyl-D-erythritol 2,4-cyclodiphosphate synthase
MNNFFIILAAGNGTRFKKKQKKQYAIYKNLKLFEHSVFKAIKSKLFKKIVLVIDNPKNVKNLYSKDLIILKGGKKRSSSSIIALKHIKKFKPKNVLIHDAARPDFSLNLLKKIIQSLKKNNAVIPITKPTDSIKYNLKNNLYNLDREKTYLTQTPQGFNFNNLYKLSLNEKTNITDEASLFINNDKKIKLINGEKKNKKITFSEDLETNKTYFGLGFDIHQLVKGKTLYLGGIKIPFHSGLKGHSDGDVILHAIIDALLGALRQKDIGTYFPSNTKKFKNIRSPKLLIPIKDKLTRLNFYINNIDINLICEKPKVSQYRDKIINSISSLLEIDKKLINLKGKTVEKLGLIGKEKAIACEVIASIIKHD